MIQPNDFNGATLGKEPDYEAIGRCVHLEKVIDVENRNRHILGIELGEASYAPNSHRIILTDVSKLLSMVESIGQYNIKIAGLIAEFNTYAVRAGKTLITVTE